jgi:hypothetical protein
VRGFIAINLKKIGKKIECRRQCRRAVREGRGSKLGLDRRRQTAEKPAGQARMIGENNPMHIGSVRHGLDIASRRIPYNKKASPQGRPFAALP